MKIIGLIGGMSWESTVPYYRQINELVKLRLGGLHSARLILYSVDFHEIEQLQHSGEWEQAGEILAEAAQSLENAGAELLVLCTNTMHKVASAIEAAVMIPLLHIADATAEAIQQSGLGTVGLLGTRFTMEQDFYRGRLEARSGITVLVPDQDDREVIHRVIYDELCLGVIREESRQSYRAVIERLVQRGAEGIILGCTEIGLLVTQSDAAVPLFDTTSIHAARAVEVALDTPQYELRWDYCDVRPGDSPPDPDHFDVHFVFTLFFPHLPPGDGYAAFFCFNVLSPSVAESEGIPTGKRGHLVRESFSRLEIIGAVERSVAEAFSRYPHEEALEALNSQYIWTELDFSAEFAEDVRDPQSILGRVHRVFDGIGRGDGRTLHEATAMDEWGDEEELRAARELDPETRWQDVPDSTIDKNSSVLVYLDTEGYRYYLPALLSWSIRRDNYRETYQSLLPLVAPRDVGRGHGERFDVRKLIEQYSWTPEQVRVIYDFLVLAVVRGGMKVEEDHYPAMLKWRKAALEGA